MEINDKKLAARKNILSLFSKPRRELNGKEKFSRPGLKKMYLIYCCAKKFPLPSGRLVLDLIRKLYIFDCYRSKSKNNEN